MNWNEKLPLDAAALDRIDRGGEVSLETATNLIAQARAALSLAARVAELEQERTDAAMRLSRAMNSPCLEVSSGGTFTGALMDFAAKRMAELEAERNGVVGALLAERAHANALRDALGLFTDNAVRCCENELGEEYLRCEGCGGTDWGSDPDCFDPDNHAEGCKYKPESLRAAASAAIAAHPATSTPESV